jgi:Holliday junction resolvasome RuvABC endonuclease subunit
MTTASTVHHTLEICSEDCIMRVKQDRALVKISIETLFADRNKGEFMLLPQAVSFLIEALVEARTDAIKHAAEFEKAK